MAKQGAKRKHVHESSDSDTPLTTGAKRICDQESSDSEPPLTTDIKIKLKAETIMKRVTDNFHTFLMDEDIISKMNKMNTVNRKKETIGIFGKSGEGKSFLLSAVLGKKNLLPSGCFGSCTAVITQVEANLTDSNYTAEIELFSKEEWEKELNKLHTVLHTDENKDSNAEFIDIAKKKISALYGNDGLKKTLQELNNDDKYTEIKNLLSSNEETKKISKSVVSEFAKDVARFIQYSAACSGDWYWPLVKSVSIKIPDCRELLEHIVLVDIPGTGDCNKIRDDLWKSKLTECSSVWIVSNINRANDDSNPWGILKHCIEELGPGGECKNINFICTKTDNIDSEEFIRDQRLTGIQNKEEKEQNKMCICLRNELAKKVVKEKFENSEFKKVFSTINDFLQVFTVSSKAFFNSSLNLESTETEIPKMQDYLKSLNKSIKREMIRDYINEAKGVLSLIQSIQLNKDKEAAEMKNSINRELRNKLMQALSELDTYFGSVYKGLEQCLSEGVEKSLESCVDATKALINPITSYNTLEALCRKGGCHCPKKKDNILDLNKTLAKHLHQCIDDDFGQFFPVCGITGKSVQEQLDKFTVIQNDTAILSLYIYNYIKAEETKIIGELKSEIVDKKKEIFLSIQKTIENEMLFCYKEAAALKGQGSLMRMKTLLQNTVNDIKKDMFNKAKIELLKKCNGLKLHVKDHLETKLLRAMDLLQSQTSKSVDVSKEIKELEGLLEQLSD